MLSLSQKKPLLVLGLPGLGLFAAGAAMGLNAVNGISDSVDSFVGPGLTAVWIGVLGLANDGNRFCSSIGKKFLAPSTCQRIWNGMNLNLKHSLHGLSAHPTIHGGSKGEIC